MVSKYSQLPETTKQKMREAHRKWASKNSRIEYYRNYETVRPNSLASKLLRNSKTNARAKGFEHNITIDDIIVPLNCPCCGEKLNSHSLDRVDNTLGYVKGNICVICWPCNQNKRQYNAPQHRMIANYIDKFM